ERRPAYSFFHSGSGPLTGSPLNLGWITAPIYRPARLAASCQPLAGSLAVTLEATCHLACGRIALSRLLLEIGQCFYHADIHRRSLALLVAAKMKYGVRVRQLDTRLIEAHFYQSIITAMYRPLHTWGGFDQYPQSDPMLVDFGDPLNGDVFKDVACYRFILFAVIKGQGQI